MEVGRTAGRKQVSVMCSATNTCTLIHTNHVNTVALLFMAEVFPDGAGLIQQDNGHCHTAK